MGPGSGILSNLILIYFHFSFFLVYPHRPVYWYSYPTVVFLTTIIYTNTTIPVAMDIGIICSFVDIIINIDSNRLSHQSREGERHQVKLSWELEAVGLGSTLTTAWFTFKDDMVYTLKDDEVEKGRGNQEAVVLGFLTVRLTSVDIINIAGFGSGSSVSHTHIKARTKAPSWVENSRRGAKIKKWWILAMVDDGDLH